MKRHTFSEYVFMTALTVALLITVFIAMGNGISFNP